MAAAVKRDGPAHTLGALMVQISAGHASWRITCGSDLARPCLPRSVEAVHDLDPIPTSAPTAWRRAARSRSRCTAPTGVSSSSAASSTACLGRQATTDSRCSSAVARTGDAGRVPRAGPGATICVRRSRSPRGWAGPPNLLRRGPAPAPWRLIARREKVHRRPRRYARSTISARDDIRGKPCGVFARVARSISREA
jgi:hypothetical protein